jgi:protein-L-isoaspartate(D-aspartate) O-methyltransferase
MDDFSAMRRRMVSVQLASRGIRNRAVLETMGEVPREEFVPVDLRRLAYRDAPLPIGEDQTISQPFMVAMMIEAAEPEPGDRVLEVGTGSGYGAAVLSRIAAQIYSIERNEKLAETARQHLERLGYDNIEVVCGDGTLGWPEHAPYNAIVVTAGGPVVPMPLREQLAIGGRLVIPIGPHLTVQDLVRVRKIDRDTYRRENLGEVRFVPLIGKAGWPES